MNYLFCRLILPLGILASVAIWLSPSSEKDGLYTNLATELIGIIVTVAYVDYILRRKDQHDWAPVQRFMMMHMEQLFFATTTAIRSSIGLERDLLPRRYVASSNDSDLLLDVIDDSRDRLRPRVNAQLDAMDGNRWCTTAQKMRTLMQSVDLLFPRYLNHLPSDMMAAALSIQSGAQHIERTIADLAVVLNRTSAELKEAGGYGLELKQHLIHGTGDKMREMLLASERIGEWVHSKRGNTAPQP